MLSGEGGCTVRLLTGSLLGMLYTFWHMGFLIVMQKRVPFFSPRVMWAKITLDLQWSFHQCRNGRPLQRPNRNRKIGFRVRGLGVVSLNRGTPIYTPKNYNPRYRDPQKDMEQLPKPQ